MAEYLYTRVLNPNTNIYNIDYPGELVRLSTEIHDTFLDKTKIKTECEFENLKVVIEPALTSEEKVVLDNLVANHI